MTSASPSAMKSPVRFMARGLAEAVGDENPRHCEPTGRANARPMTGSAKQSILHLGDRMDCFVAYAPRNDGRALHHACSGDCDGSGGLDGLGGSSRGPACRPPTVTQ